MPKKINKKILKKDEYFGLNNEDKVLKYLNNNNEDKFEKYTNKYSCFDFFNSNTICELKSRRINHYTYPTTMVGYNKLEKMKDDKEYIFFFLFTNGLYMWKYDKDQYKIQLGGRSDRGRKEIKKYAYVPVKHLQFLTNTFNSF